MGMKRISAFLGGFTLIASLTLPNQVMSAPFFGFFPKSEVEAAALKNIPLNNLIIFELPTASYVAVHEDGTVSLLASPMEVAENINITEEKVIEDKQIRNLHKKQKTNLQVGFLFGKSTVRFFKAIQKPKQHLGYN